MGTKKLMRGIFAESLLSPIRTNEDRYYTINGQKYFYKCLGNIKPPGCITNSKYKVSLNQIADLPESSYSPARLNMKDVEKGIVKYFNEPSHWNEQDLYNDFVTILELPVAPITLQRKVDDEFDSYFPGLSIYLAKPMSFDKLKRYMTHDLKGSLRKKTSCGLGFKVDRKTVARDYEDDLKSCYENSSYDYDIFWRIFLKDELRETIKDTRSIAVPQLHLWVHGMKYLGGLYEWMSDYNPPWTGYGLDDSCEAWSSKYKYFKQTSQTVYGFDLKKQDSKMSPGFVMFLERFFKRHSPIKHWGAIEWFFEQSFYSKKVVDQMGHILMFSIGEMSGNPLTILINTLHNLYTHIVHQIALKLLGLLPEDAFEHFILLGDDSIMETMWPDTYREICRIMGHEVTSESGPLLNGVTFLSQKVTNYKGSFAPYYCNTDKMFASLAYTTAGAEEYFQKLCSYYRQLLFAPKGSLEEEWKKRIEAHIYYMIHKRAVDPVYHRCFKPSHILKLERSGLVYHDATPEGGRVENKFNRFNHVTSRTTKST